MNNITVLIISNGRLEYLRQNINSLMKYNADIFVVVNGKNDQTINFLTATEKNYSYLKFFVFNETVSKSNARNKGLESVNSDIIYFLDDDTFINQDNIKILQEKFEKYPTIGVVGGPNLTPPNSSRFQNLSGIMLSSFCMSYKMSNRYLTKGNDRITNDEELILCNLAIKKDLFLKYNLRFNEKLHYNEENLLLEQLGKHNVKMMFSPQLKVYHHRRENLKSFLLQIYNSGKGRGLMSVIMPSSIKIFFILPSLFIIYLLFLLSSKVSFTLLNIYILITLYNVITNYIYHKLKLLDIVTMFIISICSHIYYGIGFIVGLIEGLIWKAQKKH